MVGYGLLESTIRSHNGTDSYSVMKGRRSKRVGIASARERLTRDDTESNKPISCYYPKDRDIMPPIPWNEAPLVNGQDKDAGMCKHQSRTWVTLTQGKRIPTC